MFDLDTLKKEYFELISIEEQESFYFKNKLESFKENESTINFINLCIATKSEKTDLLQAKALSILLSENYPENFIPYDEVKASFEKTKECEVFEWCDETYIAQEINDAYCYVKHPSDQSYSLKFRWGFEGTPHYVIGKWKF